MSPKPKWTFEVIVELKREVLDAEGRAIRESLVRVGHGDLTDVKASKRFLLEIAGEESQATAQCQAIAGEFLANPISETFKVRKLSANEQNNRGR